MNNERIIGKAYQAAEKMDLKGWVDSFTPDGTFTDMSIGVTYRGPDGPTGIGKTVEVYAKAFPDMHRELYRFFSNRLERHIENFTTKVTSEVGV
jgi:hypothetical protein